MFGFVFDFVFSLAGFVAHISETLGADVTGWFFIA